MKQNIISIRPFMGAENYQVSRNFYKDLGFHENVISSHMCYFSKQDFGFYLQDAYVKDWIDNSMIFLEVESVEVYWKELCALDLINKYKEVRLTPIREEVWGKECFIHDPSGILWHIGEFYKKAV